MKLTMLGTGNALVTECYNTCFMLKNNNKLFMVDGGGAIRFPHGHWERKKFNLLR